MRYGHFKYGEGLYGPSDIAQQTWAVLVDWDGDGVYDYENEATRVTNIRIQRGRKNLINSSRSGLEPVGIGRLTVDLDNTDGRYDPFNTKSPLYPYVRPGVKIVVLTRLTTGDQHYLFTGRIEDIVPAAGATKRTRLVASDGLAWLADQHVEFFTQAGMTVEQAIGWVLTESAWPWERLLDRTVNNLSYFWPPSGRSARQIIDDLAESVLGHFFIAADGTAKFYSRHHGLGAGTVRIKQEDLSGEVLLRSPWTGVVNSITITCHQYTAENTSVMWSLSGVADVAAGASFEVYGVFQKAIGSYITPVAGTDYAVNTAPDGSGTNITASCTLSLTVYAGGVFFRITNSSGQYGYITLLQLRGQALADNPVRVQRSDPTSQALYGPKMLVFDNAFMQDANLAGGIADLLIDQLAEAQAIPMVTIINRPELQFVLDLFDSVDLVIDQIGVAATYRVSYIEHRWLAESGQVSETVLGFEPMVMLPDAVWKFPTQIGIDSKFAF